MYVKDTVVVPLKGSVRLSSLSNQKTFFLGNANVICGGCGALMILLLLGNPVYVSASQYSRHFNIDMSYEYDDNIRLREHNKLSVSGYNVSPELGLSYHRGTISADVDATLNFAEFDKEQFNSDDQHIALALEKKARNNTLSLGAGINRDSSRTAELLDTGRVTDTAVRREGLWLTPSWLYQINRQHALLFSTRWQRVDYQSDNFVDYDYHHADVTWTYALSERSSVSLQAFGRQFENDQFLFVDSKTYGIRGGGQTALTRHLALTALVGVMEVEADYPFNGATAAEFDKPFKDTQYTVDANINYKHQRHRLAVDVNSDTQPSGDGYQQRSQRASVAYRYHMSERAEFKARALYGENESQDDSIDDARRYSHFELGMHFRLNRTWNLESRYRLRTQDREYVAGDAQSNAVFFTLSYKPQRYQ